jgi:hypothetical protein
MSTTTIKRKALRNRVKAKQRLAAIKRLTSKPTLKNIDVEEIKSTFVTKATKKETPKSEETAKPEGKKEEKVVVESKSSAKPEAKAEADVVKAKNEKQESVEDTKKLKKTAKNPEAKKSKEE